MQRKNCSKVNKNTALNKKRCVKLKFFTKWGLPQNNKMGLGLYTGKWWREQYLW